jgi:uncharacterized membrane protein YedE/YeeE
MTINWQEFTPIASLIGGAILGLSAVLLVIFKGRIAGISGIVGALMQFQNTPKDHYLWRILFLSGLIGSYQIYSIIFKVPTIEINTSSIELVIAGLLVGFGTRMGSGCTSGHGVCGLGRLSTRSLVATLSFMTSGFIVCFLLLHWIN